MKKYHGLFEQKQTNDLFIHEFEAFDQLNADNFAMQFASLHNLKIHYVELM